MCSIFSPGRAVRCLLMRRTIGCSRRLFRWNEHGYKAERTPLSSVLYVTVSVQLFLLKCNGTQSWIKALLLGFSSSLAAKRHSAQGWCICQGVLLRFSALCGVNKRSLRRAVERGTSVYFEAP